jgi:polyribonucleotide nucleotidyltransferase
VIRGIIDATGVKIDVDDTGRVNVASSDADGLAAAIQMISDITAVPEIGKTYLGKVVRIAEFGAFVEIFPGTDGLLHVSEIAEHRVKDVKDELREGDQILVKVLSIEGNRIKLSRKAVLREQRAKLGLPEVGEDGGGQGGGRGGRQYEAAPDAYAAPTEEDDEEVLVEGGEEFAAEEGEDEEGDDAPDDEPNFNRADGIPVAAVNAGGRGLGGPSGGRGPGASGGGDRRPGGGGRRRRGGRRPGGGGGGPQSGGGNR